MKLKILALVFSTIFIAIKTVGAKEKQRSVTPLIIGTTPGDFAEMTKEGLKPELEKRGFSVKLIEFSDYVTPNLALSEGKIDINIFQHKPYLDQFIKEKKLQLKPLAQVPTAPLGLYGGQLKSLNEVKDGSTVAIPNDPTNLSRALGILSDLGWIEIDKAADPFLMGLRDIIKNQKKLKIVLLEAAQLPRALADVDFAVINGNYALSSGLDLTKTLVQEKSDLYVNWAVVQEKNVNSPMAKIVIEVLNSASFKAYAKKKFKGYKFPTQW